MYHILIFDRQTEKFVSTGKTFGLSRAETKRVQRVQQAKYPGGVIAYLP